jgi:regulator of CtrA degradation
VTIRDGSQVFLDRIYEDSLALVIEARDYIASGRSKDDANGLPSAQLLVSQETMRVTSRLTQVMAWLFCQRAVASGEMTAEEALSQRFAVGGQAVCLDDRFHGDERLPGAVADLLERSLTLYQRVLRLEAMQRDRLAG